MSCKHKAEEHSALVEIGTAVLILVVFVVGIIALMVGLAGILTVAFNISNYLFM